MGHSPIHPSVHPSVRMSACLSVFLLVYLSIYLSLSIRHHSKLHRRTYSRNSNISTTLFWQPTDQADIQITCLWNGISSTCMYLCRALIDFRINFITVAGDWIMVNERSDEMNLSLLTIRRYLFFLSIQCACTCTSSAMQRTTAEYFRRSPGIALLNNFICILSYSILAF